MEDILDLGGITVGYRPLRAEDRILIQNFSITFKRGEFYIVTGGNGVGKSTFLKAIIGQLPPTGIFLGAVTLPSSGHRIPPNDIPKFINVGYIPQNPLEGIVQELTVIENVVMRRFLRHVRASDKPSLWISMKFRGFVDKDDVTRFLDLHKFPVFLKEKLFVPAVHLSGGEMQILNLAAILYEGSELLLMDEPTSKLDRVNKPLFLDLIASKSVKNGRTILMVTHGYDRDSKMIDQKEIELERNIEVVGGGDVVIHDCR